MKSFFFLIFFAIALSSCNNNGEKETDLEKKYQPEEVLTWLPDSSELAGYAHPFRFVVSLNLSCEACLYEFKRWEELIGAFNLEATYVRFIVTGHNDAFKNHINTSENISRLWYYDAKNLFYVKNNVEYNERRTFVLDSQNRIVFRGSLLFNADRQNVKKYGMGQ